METINKISQSISSPAGWLFAILGRFTSLKDVFFLLLLIVIADFITGLVASRKKGVPCSSRRLRQSISKMLCYFGVVYLLFEFQNILNIDWIASYKIVAGFIYLVELISILENMAVITENKIFMKIVKLIRGKAQKDDIVNDIINEKNEDKTLSKKDKK
ncbi:MAG: phage holin family protein [Bacteroidetes bacterium]|nr:phage holin family protein [Bacteroidota bacterium]